MRTLSNAFMNDLKNGHLTPVLERVKMDKDLGLFIRDEYVNIYYKGNSLLKLSRRGSGNYVVDIHEKLTRGVSIAQAMDDAAAVQAFIDAIPLLKEAVIQHGGSSLETEYEQLIIRANNRESRSCGPSRREIQPCSRTQSSIITRRRSRKADHRTAG